MRGSVTQALGMIAALAATGCPPHRQNRPSLRLLLSLPSHPALQLNLPTRTSRPALGVRQSTVFAAVRKNMLYASLCHMLESRGLFRFFAKQRRAVAARTLGEWRLSRHQLARAELRRTRPL